MATADPALRQMQPALPQIPRPARTRPDLRWLASLRIGAAIAVVGIHVTTWFALDVPDAVGKANWWVDTVVHSGMRWAVPIFIMISGALLLDPARQESAASFYRKRLSRIGIPLVVWTVFYIPFGAWAYGHPLHGSDWLYGIASGDPFLQIYYLYLIAGLYLGAPFLRVIVAHCSRGEVWTLAGIAMGVGMLDDIARTLLGVGGDWSLATRFVPYVGYFVAGYLLRDLVINRRRVLVAAAAYVIGLVGSAVGMWALAPARHPPSVMAGSQYSVTYTSVPVVLMAYGVWVLGKAALTPRDPRTPRRRDAWIRRLADATFGVYLLHPLFLFPVFKKFPSPDTFTGYWEHALPTWAFVFVASLLASLVLGRVPLLRRLV